MSYTLFGKFLKKQNIKPGPLADSIGVHRMTIHYWACGKRTPTLASANLVVKYFSELHGQQYDIKIFFDRIYSYAKTVSVPGVRICTRKRK